MLNLLLAFSLQIHLEFFHAQFHSCAHQHRCCGSGLFKYANHCRLHPSLLALAVVLNLRLTGKKHGYAWIYRITPKKMRNAAWNWYCIEWLSSNMCSFAWWAWSPPLKLQAKGGGGTPTLRSPCDAPISIPFAFYEAGVFCRLKCKFFELVHMLYVSNVWIQQIQAELKVAKIDEPVAECTFCSA